jgi:hypothetical protein
MKVAQDRVVWMGFDIGGIEPFDCVKRSFCSSLTQTVLLPNYFLEMPGSNLDLYTDCPYPRSLVLFVSQVIAEILAYREIGHEFFIYSPSSFHRP